MERPGNVARAQTEQRGGKIGFVYRNALKGYSAELPKAAVKELRNDPRVELVTPDQVLTLFAQSIPTGIDRVFATSNEALAINEEDDLRVDADVAVIDTGIADHEDLDVVRRTDCATQKEGTFECVDDVGEDYLGHGTHVAGTIGAIDNDYGVVGVAPGARLWSVRVNLSFPASILESSATAGVDWVASHADEIEVANMSFGCYESDCPSGLPALDTAITGAVEAGVVMVAAAGNAGIDAAETHPAAHPDVITVSALEDHDGAPGEGDDPLASFSNHGSVDVAAPGVNILSTVPWEPGYGGGWSGTSMASPHVAGAAAILAARDRPESSADVEMIRHTIVEEGNFDWEDTSGDGVQEPLLDVSNEAVFRMPPSAMTQAASEVTATTATLNATVNPGGLATTYQFEYGTDTEYSSVIPATPEAIGSGRFTVEVNEQIEGLEEGTTYHFRVVSTSEQGTSYGQDRQFTTTAPPAATTEAATAVTQDAATLNATLKPYGLETDYQFEYGKTTEYGSKVPASPKSIGSGNEDIEVSETINGLDPDTTYHYRVVATNAAGTTHGKDETVTTEPPFEFTIEEGGAAAASGYGELQFFGGQIWCNFPIQIAHNEGSSTTVAAQVDNGECALPEYKPLSMNDCEMVFEVGEESAEAGVDYDGTVKFAPEEGYEHCGTLDVGVFAPPNECTLEMDPFSPELYSWVRYKNLSPGPGGEARVAMIANIEEFWYVRDCQNTWWPTIEGHEGAWYNFYWEVSGLSIKP